MNSKLTRIYKSALSFNPRKRCEAAATLFLLTTAGILISYFVYSNIPSHHLDTVFLLEAIESTAATGIPITMTGPGFATLLPLLTKTAAEVCAADLRPTMPDGGNIILAHAYFVVYLIGLIAKILPADITISLLHSFAFALVPFLSYWILRNMGLPLVPAAVFASSIIFHPAFSFSLTGQFYFDRFFVPLGLLYFHLILNVLTRPARKNWKFSTGITLLVGILASSVHERAAIMVISITGAVVLLYWHRVQDWKVMLCSCIFSLILFLGLIYYINFIYIDSGVGTLTGLISSASNFLRALDDPAQSTKLREFLYVNFFAFGIFLVFDWRLALISFVALAPNVLGTIGGAEKTGWATHYHSFYFPVLLYAVLIGFCNFWFKLKVGLSKVCLLGFVVFGMMPLLAYSSATYAGQSGALARMAGFYFHDINSEKMKGVMELRDLIPEKSKVSTPEWAMPSLYNGRRLYLFPLGIDSADYVVMARVQEARAEQPYRAFFSYVGDQNSIAVDQCILKRMSALGFDTVNPRIIGGGVAVFFKSDQSVR